MKYYFSGVDTLKPVQRERLAPMCPCRLLSVHGPFMKTAHDWLSYLPRGRISTNEIMLDSGAFSAWSQGKPQTLDAVFRCYDELIEKHDNRVQQWWLINLDVIPGSKGVAATADQMNQAMELSDANFAKLVARYGNRVLPVYHQFEPGSRLREVAAQNAQYICISPQNDVAEPLRLKFASSAHAALRTFSPNTWTHGLATTGMRMMTKVPWYSADSISWQFGAGLGKILFWHQGGMYGVTMSERDADKSALPADHWRLVHASLREAIAAESERRGYTVVQLQTEHWTRSAFNMESIIQMLGGMTEPAKVADQGDIFSHGGDLDMVTA